jgi:hypothetical protein
MTDRCPESCPNYNSGETEMWGRPVTYWECAKGLAYFDNSGVMKPKGDCGKEKERTS